MKQPSAPKTAARVVPAHRTRSSESYSIRKTTLRGMRAVMERMHRDNESQFVDEAICARCDFYASIKESK